MNFPQNKGVVSAEAVLFASGLPNSPYQFQQNIEQNLRIYDKHD